MAAFTDYHYTRFDPWQHVKTDPAINGGNPVVTTLSVNSVSLEKGGVRPPFRQRPSGFMPPTNYQRYGYDVANKGCPNAFAVTRRGKVTDSAAGPDTTFVSSIGYGSFDPKLTDKAVLQARNSMKNQNVNYAQAFAERQQTIDLVANTARKLASAVFSARRGNISGMKAALGLYSHNISKRNRDAAKKAAAGSFEAARDLWLQFKYGWQPLLMDVHGAATDLAQRDLADDKRYAFHVTGRASSQTKGTIVGSKDGIAFGICAATRYRVITKKEYAFVRFDMYKGNGALISAASAGFTNPASLAWELLPFSFVADWFVPISSYLSQMDASLGWVFRSGSLSRKYDLRERMWQTPDPARLKSYDSYNCGGHYESRVWNFIRGVYSDFPIVTPANLLPKNPLSLSHMVSAVALLSQGCRPSSSGTLVY